MSAVNTLLNTNKGHAEVHLFSDAAEHYNSKRTRDASQATHKQNNQRRAKTWRLNDFMALGNRVTSTMQRRLRSSCTFENTNQVQVSNGLVLLAALRMYAEDVAINVADN